MRAFAILSAVLYSLVFAWGGAAWAQQYELPPDGTPIAEIRVEGLNRLAPNQITRRMELREGGEFSAASYRRDLQSIANIGTINPIELQISWQVNAEGGLLLTVEVKENPVINTIRVVGNSKFSEDQIKTELDFREGDLAPADIRTSTARNLRSFYRQGGFKAADVEVITSPTADEEAIDVIIQIDEGMRLKIKKVIFQGKEHFSDLYLKTQIHNAPGLLFFNNYYDKSLVQDDVMILTTLYQNAGYLDAEVKLGDLIYDKDDKEVTIVFAIQEGPRYRVTDAGLTGVSYFTEEEIKRITNEMTGRTFKGRRLAKAIDRIRRLYGDQGYIDTEIGYRLNKDPGAKTVRIIIEVKEAPVVYVGQVRLQMEDYQYDVEPSVLDKTIDWLAPPIKEETVRKEVRLEPGEKYRTADEVRSIERLRNLGIFRKVDVVRQPTQDPQVRDALVVVDEDPAAAFIGVTAGVGQYSGPAVTFLFEQPNVGGNADQVSLSATFGTRNQAFRARYFDRYVGDSQTSMENELYYTTARYRAYREKTAGGAIQFGRPLSEYLNGYLRFRLERVKYSRFDDDAEEDFDDYWVAAVRPMLVYDRRDNRRYPTRGYLVSGGIETGVADGFLFKVLHAYEWYKQPIPRSNVVYVYEHTVGLMPYDATEIGLGERFFAGGTSSLRGFKVRGIGPRDPGDDDLVIGGATRLTQRHELRIPLVEDFLVGRVFTDAAILEKEAFQLGTPRIGSGVGAIIDFGAINAEVDFAVPVLKESDDETQFFHLRLGSNF